MGTFNVLLFLFFLLDGLLLLLFLVLLVSREGQVHLEFHLGALTSCNCSLQNLVSEEHLVENLVVRSWRVEILVVHVRILCRIDPNEVTASLVLRNSLSDVFSVAQV